MTADDAEREAHRAIGRYVVEFSRIVLYMRSTVQLGLTEGGADNRIASLALAEAPANQITEAFFAVCEHVGKLDDQEKRVGVRLRNAVREEIKRRNDFAHGDWWIPPERSDPDRTPRLGRVKPGRTSAAATSKLLPIGQIDSIASDLFSLRQLVSEYGALCFGIWPGAPVQDPPARVRDVLRVNKAKRVVRDGRLVVKGTTLEFF